MNAISTQPLQVCIDRHLRALGYEICGDEDSTGWYWCFGDFTSRTTSLPFDTIDEATSAAVLDLVDRTSELLASAKLVLQSWDSGDLAAAVRDLGVSVAALTAVGADDKDPVPADSRPVEADLILDAKGARIGRRAWLVQGDDAYGPWIEVVYLDLDAAINMAREIGQDWLDEGHAIDLDDLERALRANLECSASSTFNMRLKRVDVIG